MAATGILEGHLEPADPADTEADPVLELLSRDGPWAERRVTDRCGRRIARALPLAAIQRLRDRSLAPCSLDIEPVAMLVGALWGRPGAECLCDWEALVALLEDDPCSEGDLEELQVVQQQAAQEAQEVLAKRQSKPAGSMGDEDEEGGTAGGDEPTMEEAQEAQREVMDRLLAGRESLRRLVPSALSPEAVTPVLAADLVGVAARMLRACADAAAGVLGVAAEPSAHSRADEGEGPRGDAGLLRVPTMSNASGGQGGVTHRALGEGDGLAVGQEILVDGTSAVAAVAALGGAAESAREVLRRELADDVSRMVTETRRDVQEQRGRNSSKETKAYLD